MKFFFILFCAISLASAFKLSKKTTDCDSNVFWQKDAIGFDIMTKCNLDFLIYPGMPKCKSDKEDQVETETCKFERSSDPDLQAVILVLPEGQFKIMNWSAEYLHFDDFVKYHNEDGLKRDPCPSSPNHLKYAEKCIVPMSFFF